MSSSEEFDFDFDFDAPDFGSPVDEGIAVLDSKGEEVTVAPTSAAFEVAKRIVEKTGELSAMETDNEELLAKQKRLEVMKRELQSRMDIVTQDLYNIKTELFDYSRNRRRLNDEIAALRRQLSQVMFNETAQEKLANNRLEFSKTMQQFAYADKILPHQVDGAFILSTNMRCILGDKRGAGKTLTSIAAWDMAQSQKVLVIVPDDVVSNFVNEIHYWAPHRNVIQVGKQNPSARSFAIEMARMAESVTVVCNYSAWRKDKGLIDDLVSVRFDTVVLDEAHEIKNTSTSAYKGVKSIVLAENVCPKCNSEVKNYPTVDGWSNYDGCVVCDWRSDDREFKWERLDRCSVKMVVPMSGTVILNKPQDLFALLSLVDPDNFAREKDYLRDYCQQNFYTSKWEFRSGGLASLQKRLSGRYIAREGVKTPGQTITYHDIEMDKELYPRQWSVIEQLSKHAQIMLDSGKKMTVLATIALITRKRQANVWPAGIKLKDDEGNVVFDAGEDVQESIKIDKCIMQDPITNELSGLIPEFTENGDMELGSRVIVFSQFKGPLQELERRLTAAGISVARMDGDTPQARRDEIKIDFDRKYNVDGYEPKWQVLLANYKTGGVGLNFTAATETIILDKEWNPGKEDQAFGRTDRLGQTEHTNVHILRIPRTIDVWMDQINEEKANLIAGFNNIAEPLSNQLLDAMKNGDII